MLGPTALDPDPSEGKGMARRFLFEGIKGEEEEEEEEEEGEEEEERIADP